MKNKRKKILFILIAFNLAGGIAGRLVYGAQAKKKERVARKIKLEIHDKITLITHPLMIKAIRRDKVVTFKWSEPHWDFKYFLEIYQKGKRRPYGVLPVSGGVKNLKFKPEERDLYWRISAISRHGIKSPNRKLFLVPLR